jgi:hypothetical protein
MRPAQRLISWIVAMLLAGTAGTLPACASMGGGGMKYVFDPQTPCELITVL